MQEKEEKSNLKWFLVIVFLWNIPNSNAQTALELALDTLKSYQKYHIPMPDEIGWGHDIFIANNFLQNSKIAAGNWVQYYELDSSKIARIFHINDSSLHGKDLFFEKDGSLKMVQVFENGFLRSKMNYTGGIIRGSIKYGNNGAEYIFFWHSNGELEYSESKEKVERFYESGKLMLSVPFNGKYPHGESVYVDRTGEEHHVIWENGVRQGCYKYDSDGRKEKFRFRKLPKSIRKLYFVGLLR